MTTLKKQDNTTTTDLLETINCMLDYFIPVDEDNEDNEHHKGTRNQARGSLGTQDDTKFTQQEIKEILEDMNPKKAPGENGINSKIHLQVFKILPSNVTAIYNSCLKMDAFQNSGREQK
jgi:hypothetical protein